MRFRRAEILVKIKTKKSVMRECCVLKVLTKVGAITRLTRASINRTPAMGFCTYFLLVKMRDKKK
jgi:hypothetical protein